MENQFVTYEIAKQLKELGFNYPCMKFYTEEYKKLCNSINPKHYDGSELPTKPVSAPLWQQVIDWLREKHKLIIDVVYDIDGLKNNKYVWFYVILKDYSNRTNDKSKGTEIYEDAREAAILKALELITNNKK